VVSGRFGYPSSGLIALNGIFYGTDHNGGYGYGAVYSITPSGDVKVLHSFNYFGSHVTS
jgi:uncharacterized repeat protein (TIGR03803 family)